MTWQANGRHGASVDRRAVGSQQHRAAVGRRFEDAEQHLHHMPALGPGADVVAVLVEGAHPLVRICDQTSALPALACPSLRTQAGVAGILQE